MSLELLTLENDGIDHRNVVNKAVFIQNSFYLLICLNIKKYFYLLFKTSD